MGCRRQTLSCTPLRSVQRILVNRVLECVLICGIPVTRDASNPIPYPISHSLCISCVQFMWRDAKVLANLFDVLFPLFIRPTLRGRPC